LEQQETQAAEPAHLLRPVAQAARKVLMVGALNLMVQALSALFDAFCATPVGAPLYITSGFEKKFRRGQPLPGQLYACMPQNKHMPTTLPRLPPRSRPWHGYCGMKQSTCCDHNQDMPQIVCQTCQHSDTQHACKMARAFSNAAHNEQSCW
jgi:hypothetical protein